MLLFYGVILSFLSSFFIPSLILEEISVIFRVVSLSTVICAVYKILALRFIYFGLKLSFIRLIL